MITSDNFLCNSFRDNRRGDWEAISESFSSSQDIRVRVRRGQGLMSPECTGAGETALNFIVDKNGTNFVASSTESGEEFWGCNVDTAFALDRLYEHAAGGLCDEIFENRNVVEGAMF